MAETDKGNLTLSNACTATPCSGGSYDLIAFWLIAVDHFCDLGAEVVDCFGLTYVGRASPDIFTTAGQRLSISGGMESATGWPSQSRRSARRRHKKARPWGIGAVVSTRAHSKDRGE